MKMINQKGKRKNDRGFTLIETLVAITILSIAITATFTAAQSGLSSAIESRDQIIAHYMAQEAVEFIRNKRDENSLLSQNWLTGIAEVSGDPCYPGKACIVDAAQNSLTACSSGPGSCSNLRQNTTQGSSTYGMYGYDGTWSLTGFNREVSVEVIDSAQEILMTVTITRTKGTITQTFKVKESIFNWQS